MFSLNKKKLKIKKGRLQDWNPGSPMQETDSTTQPQSTDNREDPYTEPNSCLSDFPDSLNSMNSLNSMEALLHLE